MKLLILLCSVMSVMAGTCKECEVDMMQLHDQAVAESMIPVRNGVQGVRPFWNEYAFRFMNVPAFDFDTVDNAACYRFTAKSSKGGEFVFTAQRPDALLTPVWQKMPVGDFTLKVEAIGEDGEVIGLSGEKKSRKAAVYNGPYREDYDYAASAQKALQKLYQKSFVRKWLETGEPDPEYHYRYRYAAKMIGGVIEGAVVYARIKPKPADADEVLKIGVAAADYLLTRHYPAGSPLEYFPPTYDKMEAEGHMNVDKCMFMYGADVGQAYLGLFEITGDKKYFDAAERIADGFKRLQLDSGTWYLVVDVKTGKPINDNLINPPLIINYLDTFIKKYGRTDLQSVVDKAIKWTFDNPMKTFNWQNQFEDSPPDKPYRNLSHVEPCLFAIYLLQNADRNPSYIELARELIRYVEDQFVVWSDPPSDSNRNWDNALFPAEYYATDKWVLPCVGEQYLFWQPVGGASTNFVLVLKKAYEVTGDRIYLAKAKDLANNVVYVQEKYHNGEYLTYLTTLERDYWINCTTGTAAAMFEFGNVK
ncbi:MAG: hypothetical protein ACIAQZ_11050 [Sedimentisphaeraceae bacterium JB056]